ncbi:MAG: DMT family transporter [Rhodocyclaceae bacterium]|nr:DMT family transporter [Rhodocyclaceae bacterium]
MLTGAAVWGLVWYPYRALEQAGFSSTTSTALTYAISLAIGLLFLRVPPGEWRSHWRPALLIAFTAGWTNLAYVLAMVGGEVMRVLLLFYLAPLWTVVLARVLLGERLTLRAGVLVALSLGGALVMLWPESGLPLPANAAEWLGLTGGLSFATMNVLSKGAEAMSVEAKSLATWAGVLLVSAVWLAVGGGVWALPALGVSGWPEWLVLAILGVVMYAITLIIQFGITRVPANTAIVLFLFELVAGAVSSALLSDESLRPQDWLGGALIVSASLVAAVGAPRRERAGESSAPG